MLTVIRGFASGSRGKVVLAHSPERSLFIISLDSLYAIRLWHHGRR